MEPFEWLLLGAGLAVGSLLGSRGKGLMRTVAKGYLVAADTTRNVTANLREDFRDAIEEARYEREEEAALREADLQESMDDDQAGIEDDLVEDKPRVTAKKSTSASTREKRAAAHSAEPAA